MLLLRIHVCALPFASVPLPPAAILPGAVVLVGGALYLFGYIAGGIFIVGWVPNCIPQELIYGILAQFEGIINA